MFFEAVGGSLIIVFVVLLVVASFFWERSRSNKMIERWVSENGLQLVASSRCYWTLGTPFWAAPKGSTVYRITVEDSVGSHMSGYALCGSSFLGLWSDRIEVKFDSPDFEKRKNDGFEKPKNDFRKRKNGLDVPDFDEYDYEELKNDSGKHKNRI